MEESETNAMILRRSSSDKRRVRSVIGSGNGERIGLLLSVMPGEQERDWSFIAITIWFRGFDFVHMSDHRFFNGGVGLGLGFTFSDRNDIVLGFASFLCCSVGVSSFVYY